MNWAAVHALFHVVGYETPAALSIDLLPHNERPESNCETEYVFPSDAVPSDWIDTSSFLIVAAEITPLSFASFLLYTK